MKTCIQAHCWRPIRFLSACCTILSCPDTCLWLGQSTTVAVEAIDLAAGFVHLVNRLDRIQMVDTRVYASVNSSKQKQC